MQALVSKTIGLLRSPRVRESDAGARLLAIIFRKHVVQLNWSIECAPHNRVSILSTCSAGEDGLAPVMVFIESLLHMFQVCKCVLHPCDE